MPESAEQESASPLRNRRQRRNKGKKYNGAFRAGMAGDLIPIKQPPQTRFKSFAEQIPLVPLNRIIVLETNDRTTAWGVWCGPCEEFWPQPNKKAAEGFVHDHFEWHIDEIDRTLSDA